MAKPPSKSWFDLVEDEQSVQEHMECMAAILLQSVDIFSSPPISCAFSETLPTLSDLLTDTNLSFGLAF